MTFSCGNELQLAGESVNEYKAIRKWKAEAEAGIAWRRMNENNWSGSEARA